MRKSSHPRAAHLHEELHVEIVAFAPPAEAYARMAYALTQVRRYLIPDNNDQVRVWGRGGGGPSAPRDQVGVWTVCVGGGLCTLLEPGDLNR